jgi:hypothetical protein
MQNNMHNADIKIIETINLVENIDKILVDPCIIPNNIPDKISCPWCTEHQDIENILKNDNKMFLEMGFDDCIEHMKTCSNKINHDNIEINLALTLQQTLKNVSGMMENFKILSTNYEILKQRNEEIKTENDELLKKNNMLNNEITKFSILKTKYRNLKDTHKTTISEWLEEKKSRCNELQKENQTKYDELFKASLLREMSQNNSKKVNLTINGGTNNINLLTYIGDNCKNAEPINAIDNNRKMAINKLLITKGITETPKITEIIAASTSTSTLTSTSTVTSTSTETSTLIPKLPDMNDETLSKMFIEGYADNESSYHVFIADILVKYFKKDDVTKQPMWSTDTSRCSYIIKILPDDWVKDKSGVALLDKCIKPFIDYIDDVIRKYSESLENEEIKIQNKFMEETKNTYIKKFKGKRLERFDFTCIENCMICNEELYNFAANKSLGLDIKNINTQQTRLGEILVCINKEGFSKKVIKEITPYFASDRLKLNPLSITDTKPKKENNKSCVASKKLP